MIKIGHELEEKGLMENIIRFREETRRVIKKSVRDYRKGRIKPWSQLKVELGL